MVKHRIVPGCTNKYNSCKSVLVPAPDGSRMTLVPGCSQAAAKRGVLNHADTEFSKCHNESSPMGRIHKVSRHTSCGANRLARFSTRIHFGKGKCKLIANFSAKMVKSLPSVSLSLSLLSTPHT